jgi:hypothetical protein
MSDLFPGVLPLEIPHLEKFRTFYQGLPDRRNPVFMFFTTGLLHWVARSLSFVPPEVNVIVLGSRLSEAEIEWARQRLGRPFHHIDLPVDDKTIWEFLFATCESGFGWLDIDCFVLNPRLFDEMRQVPADALANSIWTFRGAGGHDVLSTFFLFLNGEAVRQTRALGVTPCTYSYGKTRDGRSAPYATCRIPSREIIDRLRSMLPTGSDGLPVYLGGPFYDTLQVYQMVATTCGFRLNRVRQLYEGAATDEIMHVGKVSYYDSTWTDRDLEVNRKTFALIMQADYLALSGVHDSLPPSYSERFLRLGRALHGFGIEPSEAGVRSALSRFLAKLGVSFPVLEEALGAGPSHR